MNTQWIEDWFGSDYYSMLYQHRSSEEAHTFLDHLMSYLKMSSGLKILDAGCGKGRHSIYLSKKGFQVTGIDVSTNSIAGATLHDKNAAEFYVHDLRNPFRINYYDLALSLFTSFGYFDSDYENNKIIQSISLSLKKGGMLVLDFMNAEKEMKELVASERCTMKEVYFSITRKIKSNNCIAKEISIHHQEKKYLYHENVKAYSLHDFKTIFAQNHLEIANLFGDYSLSSFNAHTSNRLIILAIKK
jgi:SAM-dependent methyltransferase